MRLFSDGNYETCSGEESGSLLSCSVATTRCLNGFAIVNFTLAASFGINGVISALRCVRMLPTSNSKRTESPSFSAH